MHESQLQKISLSIIKVCFYALLFAPLILSASFFFPAIFPKTVYLRLLIELAFIFYLPLVLADKRFRPQGHIIYWSVAVFAVMVFITALAGINWHYSFWGNYERMDGIFSWLHYWVLILMMSCVLRAKADWRKLIAVALGAAILVTGYGFLQYTGVQSIGPLKIYESGAGRLQGSVVNPGFLAAYLLFNLTLALLLVIDAAAKIGFRIFGGLAWLWLAVGFSLTGVRGAFVGLVAGLVFFGLGYLFWHKHNSLGRKIGLGLLVAFLFIISLLVVFRKSAPIAQNSILGRIVNINLSDPTVQSRLVSWQGVLPSIKENFWLGVGPQKFDYVFNRYFDPKFYTAIGGETWWDRAHNMVLEVFATMGIFGLAAYLLVGLAVLYTLFHLGRIKSGARVEALILMGFFIAYFIQNLFVFDSVNTYFILAIFIAYVVARSIETESAPYFGRLWRFKMPVVRRVWLFLAVIFLLLAPVAYAGNIKLIEHNRLLLRTLAYQGQSPFGLTLDSFRRIFALSDFDQRETAIKLGAWLSQYGLNQSMTQSDFEGSYRVLTVNMEKARRLNPQDVRLLLAYGNALNVYGELAIKVDKNLSQSILEKAGKVFQEAIKLGPGRQQVYFSLANTYLIGGDTERGIALLEKTAQLNEDNATTHWLLAFAYTQAKEPEKALAASGAALDKNYSFNSEKEATPIAQIYLDKKDYAGLLRLYARVAQTVPTGTAQARLAALYAQLGRKEEAISAANEVIRRDPSLRSQVEDFIRQVENGTKTDFLK